MQKMYRRRRGNGTVEPSGEIHRKASRENGQDRDCFERRSEKHKRELRRNNGCRYGRRNNSTDFGGKSPARRTSRDTAADVKGGGIEKIPVQ